MNIQDRSDNVAAWDISLSHKKDVVNDKDSEQSDGSLCQAQRMYIREKVKKAQIFF